MLPPAESCRVIQFLSVCRSTLTDPRRQRSIVVCTDPLAGESSSVPGGAAACDCSHAWNRVLQASTQDVAHHFTLVCRNASLLPASQRNFWSACHGPS